VASGWSSSATQTTQCAVWACLHGSGGGVEAAWHAQPQALHAPTCTVHRSRWAPRHAHACAYTGTITSTSLTSLTRHSWSSADAAAERTSSLSMVAACELEWMRDTTLSGPPPPPPAPPEQNHNQRKTHTHTHGECRHNGNKTSAQKTRVSHAKRIVLLGVSWRRKGSEGGMTRGDCAGLMHLRNELVFGLAAC
jgi:hypothetical protein